MTDLLKTPGLPLLLSAALLPWARGRWRGALLVLAPAVALVLTWTVESSGTLAWFGLTLQPVASDDLARVFATAFALITALGGLFAHAGAGRTELAAAHAQAGAALVAVFAGDWVTLVVAWELMAISSTVVIVCSSLPGARGAGLRYFAVHALGGVLLLAGIAAHVSASGSAGVGPVTVHAPGGWLMLAGVLVNAGAPPFSAWIADAYPEASPCGMVFLSAFATKTAVYVLLRSFAGTQLLIWIGLYMVFHGIVFALLENDMRRILAYSIVNQVGFMVCGAGLGTELAVNGAAAHAFAHILYKGLLLMSAGSVLWMTGHRRCTDLGGLYRSMPLTATCGIVGALAISAFPWTSGFVTKSMISAAAGELRLTAPWFLLTAASAGVFLHAGVKFPWFVFFHRDSGLRPSEPPWSARMAMVLAALACLVPGLAPATIHRMLPHEVPYEAYAPSHVVGQLQLLLFAGLAFFVLLPFLERTRTVTLDFDWTYRWLGPRLVAAVAAGLSASRRAAGAALSPLPRPRPVGRTPPGGFDLSLSVLLLTLLLAALLLLTATR